MSRRGGGDGRRPCLGVVLALGLVGTGPGAAVASGARLPLCAAAVTSTVAHIGRHVYAHDARGITSGLAMRRLEASGALRQAVIAGDAANARAVVLGLLGGRVPRVRVYRGAVLLAEIGRGPALAARRRVLRDAGGRAIGRIVLAEQRDSDFVELTRGVAGAEVLVRAGARQLIGTLTPGPASLPHRGLIDYQGTTYGVASFAGRSLEGEALRISYLVPVSSVGSLCGRSAGEAVANTVGLEALRIYQQELHSPATTEASHIIATAPDMLDAVRAGDPVAVRAAIVRLFGTALHVVRIRVSRGGSLLNDVGGPAVLAPVAGSFLDSGGQVIGNYLFSLQDDAGFLKLAREFTGADVLMRVSGRQVAGTLHPGPPAPPRAGPVHYAGVDYHAFSFFARAFPSGPLRITILVRAPRYL